MSSDGSFPVLCAVFLKSGDYKRRYLEEKQDLVQRTLHNTQLHCRHTLHSCSPSNTGWYNIWFFYECEHKWRSGLWTV